MIRYAGAALLLARMKADQWKSASELEEMQGRKLARLLAHARARVPHYRGLPAIRDMDGLRTLPFLTKAQIRKDNDSLLDSALDKAKLIRHPTSGSTGTPIIAYYSLDDGVYGTVLRYHHLTESGLRPQHLLADLLHSHEPRNLLQRLGLFRTGFLSVLDHERKNLDLLARMNPDMLLAFPSALALMGSLNLKEERPVRLKRIFSQSEFLPEGTRELASRSFGCEVRSAYAANEMRTIAWECEKGSMHVNPEFIIEIVDGGGNPIPDGRSGEIVLTPLWRYSMPFIRYRIGDRGSLGGRCGCGRGMTVLRSLEGRTNDFLVLPSGRKYPGSCAGAELKWFDFIVQYQIVQEADGSLLVRIVPDRKIGEKHLKEVARRLMDALQEPVRVDVEAVERIGKTASGKLQCVISKLNKPSVQYPPR